MPATRTVPPRLLGCRNYTALGKLHLQQTSARISGLQKSIYPQQRSACPPAVHEPRKRTNARPSPPDLRQNFTAGREGQAFVEYGDDCRATRSVRGLRQQLAN